MSDATHRRHVKLARHGGYWLLRCGLTTVGASNFLNARKRWLQSFFLLRRGDPALKLAAGSKGKESVCLAVRVLVMMWRCGVRMIA